MIRAAHDSDSNIFIRRIIVVALFLVVLIVLLCLRLIHLQVWQHSRYTTLSKHNQFEVISIKPNRGLIYDRNGELLAENIPVFALEVTPNRATKLKDTVEGLRKIVNIDDDDVTNFYKQVRQHRPFEPIPLRLHLTEEERATFAVNRYKFPGVDIKARLIRHYPYGSSFSHVLGYVGRINEYELKRVDSVNYSGTNFIGKLGIEKYYEKRLHGTVGYEQAEIDASGRIIRVLHRSKPVRGQNLYLTIDAKLQLEIEKAMQFHRGAVVAIVPKTGEVLAMVSSPSYDPNPFVNGISQKAYNTLRKDKNQPLFNRAIRGQYPLASTIKPFLAIKALDDEIVTPKTRIWDKGYYKLPNNNHVYRDWKRGGHGWVDMHRAILVSCDTYFYELANKMGIKRMDKILTQFGFGVYSKVDLGEELPGLIPTPDWKVQNRGESWYTGDTLISGIGQGFMLTTPLQLASATATLAARGDRIRPHLLLREESADKTTKYNELIHEFPITLSDKYIWDFVINAMEDVVSMHGGTGYRFGRDAPYTVAAKTGTGQVYSAKNHAHISQKDLPEHLRDHTLFIAFAPVDDPQIAIAITVENSSIASNLARRVLDFYLLGKKRPVIVKKS